MRNLPAAEARRAGGAAAATGRPTDAFDRLATGSQGAAVEPWGEVTMDALLVADLLNSQKRGGNDTAARAFFEEPRIGVARRVLLGRLSAPRRGSGATEKTSDRPARLQLCFV